MTNFLGAEAQPRQSVKSAIILAWSIRSVDEAAASENVTAASENVTAAPDNVTVTPDDVAAWSRFPNVYDLGRCVLFVMNGFHQTFFAPFSVLTD